VRQELAFLLFALIGVALVVLVWRSVRSSRRRDSSLRVDLFNKREP